MNGKTFDGQSRKSRHFLTVTNLHHLNHQIEIDDSIKSKSNSPKIIFNCCTRLNQSQVKNRWDVSNRQNYILAVRHITEVKIVIITSL